MPEAVPVGAGELRLEQCIPQLSGMVRM
jgi:hypothetical protein